MAKITSVEITNLRGIRSGKVEDIRPLTIFTGTNGSGKSAILDALLIGASPSLADAVGQAVHRRSTLGGAHWLFHRRSQPGADAPTAQIALQTTEGRFERHLEFEPTDPYAVGDRDHRFSVHASQIESGACRTYFSLSNRYSTRGDGPHPAPLPFVRIIEPGRSRPLHASYSAAVRAGFRDEVWGILADVGVSHMDVLTDLDEQTPALYVNLEPGSAPLPLSLAGDGIQSLAHTAIELATVPRGCALLEEPESFQHPLSFGQTANVLVAAVLKRDIQVVLTTHSQELIDRILSELTPEHAEQVSIITCALRHGELRTVAAAGETAFELRQELSEDLR